MVAAVIVDDATGEPRMTGRFGDDEGLNARSGIIYSYRYPGDTVQPNASISPASVILVAHSGGWREGALFYREWLRSKGTEDTSIQLNWFLNRAHLIATTIPAVAVCAERRCLYFLRRHA